MGILDLTRGYGHNLKDFLNSLPKEKISGDLKALSRVADNWDKRFDQPLDIGESGTIYRFIKMYNWINKIPHDPIVSGTLIERSKNEMTNNPEIASWTMDELRKLDHNTTQWATMKYLLSSPEEREKSTPVIYKGNRLTRDGDFKLRVTYDSVDHWESQRSQGKNWETRKDPTFIGQLSAFAKALETGEVEYTGEQAEDYCFERAFNLIDESEGRLVYPTVEGHETDRFKEMERVISLVDKGKPIDSKDHRVVQSIVMREIFFRGDYKVIYQDAPNKTWPGFWNAINTVLTHTNNQ
jgi:hypothetical protein